MPEEMTKDSLVRAIASAPPIEPPRSESPARPPQARASVRWILVVICVTVALGAVIHAFCAPVGRPLASWTLVADGGTHDVSLPTNLYAQLGFRELPYRLATDVELSPEERGHSLTLSLTCFHADLALTVDGRAIADDGDVYVADHRYAIPATGRSTLHLELTAVHDMKSSLGFGVVPRLELGSEPRSAAGTLNRFAAIAALILGVVCGLFYGLLYVLDRGHREYLAAVVMSVAVGVMFLGLLGPVVEAAGRFEVAILGFAAATLGISTLHFQRLALELPAFSRWWSRGWGVVAATSLLSAFSHVSFGIAALAMVAMGVATTSYVLVRYLRIAAGTSLHHLDARILLIGMSPSLAGTLVEGTWWIAGVHPLDGVHGYPIVYGLAMIAQLTVLARQFVARQRTVEQTSAELRRLVADRSRQLADALAKLAQAPRADLAIDQIIDERYRVVRRLGAGGMGTVYEVERIADGTRLALKALRGRIDEAAMARLAREAQIAAELHHPNLVPVLDVGVANLGLYIVMELVDGGSLEESRARFGDRTWAQPIVVQIARGLAAIHGRGIVHRDLKPGNILISHGIARIADFGLASSNGVVDVGGLDETAPQSPSLTRIGDVFGTPAYMAPELAAGAKDAAPSSDMFSFGLVAHELMVGRSPCAEPAVISRLHGRPIVIDVAPDLAAILGRCLDLDPALRPSADDVAAALG